MLILWLPPWESPWKFYPWKTLFCGQKFIILLHLSAGKKPGDRKGELLGC